MRDDRRGNNNARLDMRNEGGSSESAAVKREYIRGHTRKDIRKPLIGHAPIVPVVLYFVRHELAGIRMWTRTLASFLYTEPRT